MQSSQAIPDKVTIIVQPAGFPLNETPYSQEVWKHDIKKITQMANGFDSRIRIVSLDWLYLALEVPTQAHDNVIEAFNNRGYVAYDEPIARISLNESVPLINGPVGVQPPSGSAYNLTGIGSIIAVLDSGIDPTHPDFQGRILNWDDQINVGSAVIQDPNGHGTAVASIAAGSGVNSSGIFRGVASGADLVISRVCDVNGDCPILGIIQGLIFARLVGADVISISLGSPSSAARCSGRETGPYGQYFNEINTSINNGIFVVAVAGNSGPGNATIEFPGCVDRVIAVGAVWKSNVDNYTTRSPDADLMLDESSYLNFRINVNNNETTYEVPASASRQIYQTNLGEFGRWGGGVQRLYAVAISTNVNVNFQGQWREHNSKWFVLCYGQTDKTGWDPGNANKDDAFWNKQFSGSGPFIHVEVEAMPNHRRWGFCDEWKTWYENDGASAKVKIWQSLFGNKDRVTIYSSRGPAPHNAALVKPTVLAPTNVCAARTSAPTSAYQPACGFNRYTMFGGTSAATPHVAGAIAILREARPTATYNEIYNALINGAVKRNSYDPDAGYDRDAEGYGRINLKQSASLLGANVFPPCTNKTDVSLAPNVGFGGNGVITRYRLTIKNNACTSKNYQIYTYNQTLFSVTSSKSSLTVNSGQSDSSTVITVTPKNTFQEGVSYQYNIDVDAVSSKFDRATATYYVPFCNHEKPNVTIIPSYRTGDLGKTLYYDVRIENNDYPVCGRESFNITISPDSSFNAKGWAFGVTQNKTLVDSGFYNTTQVWITAPASGQRDGNYTFRVTVVNSKGDFTFDRVQKNLIYALACVYNATITPQFSTQTALSKLSTVTITDKSTSFCSNSITHKIKPITGGTCDATNTYVSKTSLNIGRGNSDSFDVKVTTTKGSSCALSFNVTDVSDKVEIKGLFGVTDDFPQISLVSPQNTSYSTSSLPYSIPLTFTINEPVNWIGYSLDNQNNITITGNTTISIPTSGSHNIRVYANNSFGNIGASNKVFFIVNEVIPNSGCCGGGPLIVKI